VKKHLAGCWGTLGDTTTSFSRWALRHGSGPQFNNDRAAMRSARASRCQPVARRSDARHVGAIWPGVAEADRPVALVTTASRADMDGCELVDLFTNILIPAGSNVRTIRPMWEAVLAHSRQELWAVRRSLRSHLFALSANARARWTDEPSHPRIVAQAAARPR